MRGSAEVLTGPRFFWTAAAYSPCYRSSWMAGGLLPSSVEEPCAHNYVKFSFLVPLQRSSLPPRLSPPIITA